MFSKIILSNPIPSITTEIAKECYSLLKQYGSISEAFSNSNICYFSYFEETMNEIDRLEKYCNEQMYSDNKPQSKIELRNRISSDLIDCDIFINDYIDYVLTYIEDITLENFI